MKNPSLYLKVLSVSTPPVRRDLVTILTRSCDTPHLLHWNALISKNVFLKKIPWAPSQVTKVKGGRMVKKEAGF